MVAAHFEIFCQGRKRTPHLVAVIISTLGISSVNRNLAVLCFRRGVDFNNDLTPLTRSRNVAHILVVGLLN